MSKNLVPSVKVIVSETIRGIVANKTDLFPELSEIKSIREDVDSLKSNILIDPEQQLKLQRAVSRRVDEVITEYDWQKLKNFIYPDIYRMLKTKFAVSRYSYIKAIDFERALKYVAEYKPTEEFKERMQLKMEK